MQRQISCSPILRCLVLSLFPLVAFAGDSEAWNVHEYEYDLVESVLLVVLVVFALAFEISWHHVVHEVKHSYHYGLEHDNFIHGPEDDNDHSGHHAKDSHGNLIHPRLVRQLVTRMSGEFMTLGFLALMIFTLNQAEFFDFLARNIRMSDSCSVDDHRRMAGSTDRSGLDSSDCWHVPTSGNDWLHMAEVVHVKLFLSMILYFCIIARVVTKTNEWIHAWEKLRLRRLMEGEYPIPTASSHWSFDPDLKKHKELRIYLIENVLLANGSRTKLFNELVSRLEMDLKTLTKKQKIQRIRNEIDERLSLSSYLAFNLEVGVTDSIEVHVTTWIGIMLMFATFALFNRFAKIEMVFIFPWFVGIGICFVLFIHLINMYQRGKIHRFVEDMRDEEIGGNDVDHVLTEGGTPEAQPGIGKGYSANSLYKRSDTDALGPKEHRTCFERCLKERHVMRGLQGCMFVMTYALAETLADKHKWLEVPVQNLVFTLVYFILFLAMLFILPAKIPVFLQVTALPPFVNRQNAEILLYVVLDDHSLLKGKHEIRKKLRDSGISDKEKGSTSVEDDDQVGYRTALELADIIAQCKDFQALAQVKETLLQRVHADGSGLRCDAGVGSTSSVRDSCVSAHSSKTHTTRDSI